MHVTGVAKNLIFTFINLYMVKKVTVNAAMSSTVVIVPFLL